MRYEILEHAVDLPRAGFYARSLARFEREFARWLATDEGRRAIGEARLTLYERADAAPPTQDD